MTTSLHVPTPSAPFAPASTSDLPAGMRARLDRWLARCHAGTPAAVVLGGSVNGLSFVRSLGRRGVPVLMLETERLIGTYTRLGEVLLLPPAAEAEDVWLGVLGYVGARLPAPAAIFSTADAYGVLLARHQEALRAHYRFIVPTAEAMERIVNKRLQYGAAEAAGVPIPRTFFPDSVAEAREAAGAMTYPCILKPYKAHEGRKKITGKKAIVVQSPEELVAVFAELVAGGSSEFMVQELVPGDDTSLFGYLAFWDEESRERAWLTKQKLRQSSAFGDGAYQATVDAPEVAALARRLLSAIGYRGFVGVEFRRDPRDGVYKLMEINPRTVSGNQMAISAGVDFPWIGYRFLTAGTLAPADVAAYRRGVHYVNEEWDFRAYLGLRGKGGPTLGQWLRDLRRAEARAIGAWDDPRPLAVAAWRIARASLRRLTGG